MISQNCLVQTNMYTLLINLDEVPINRGIFTLYIFAQKCENPASTWYKITMTSVQTKMREMEGLNHFFSRSCSSRFFSLAMWKITPIRNQCNQNDNYDCSRNSPRDNGMICVIFSCKRRKRKLKNDKYNLWLKEVPVIIKILLIIVFNLVNFFRIY